MSSPLSSLKKSHKNPIMLGTRHVPFRLPEYSEDESKLLDDITHSMATSRMKTHQRDPFTGGLPKLDTNRTHVTSTSYSPRNQSSQIGPNDHELMSVMMNRITLLEQKVKSQSKEIFEKDKKINILEDKVKIMQKAQGEMTVSQSHHLERKCLLLQQQVHEMEAFLADYGMVWVGDKSDPSSDLYNDSTSLSSGSEEETWRPDSSLSTSAPEFKADYDKLIENIKDLNVLAGEGVSKIQHTTDGARLKLPEPIPLTLYANGMVMFSGPFRPFTDIQTQQYIQDITDGYFPSELQTKYPDGIPFTVTDLRDVYFKDNRNEIFTGAGQILGGDTKPSRLVPDVKSGKQDKKYKPPETTNLKVATELPGPKMTVGQFLQKLPKSVVKDGKIIDIRNSVGETIKGNKDSTDITVVETETVKDMKKRLDGDVANRPMTPRDITTLRIKDETGNHTYILKMKFHETIGDLRKYINLHRPGDSPPYQIMTTYPNKIYDKDSATLAESGLTPNAVLYLRLLKS